MKILITGATGLLGSSLTIWLRALNHEVVTVSRSGDMSDFAVDFTQQEQVNRYLDQVCPDAIVNLIGLTSVEYCEQNPNDSYRVNCSSVENIVSWIKNRSVTTYLLHISTDHFYDKVTPSTESEIVIRNVYAMTKYAGDLAAQSVNSGILRTNFVGKSKNKNRESLSDWVFNSLSNGLKIDVLDDVFFNPLSISSLCQIISQSLSIKILGVYNAGSSSYMSKADFDYIFAKELGLNTTLMRKIKTQDATFLRADRPKSMIMDIVKLEKRLGIKLPSLEAEIVQISKEYKVE